MRKMSEFYALRFLICGMFCLQVDVPQSYKAKGHHLPQKALSRPNTPPAHTHTIQQLLLSPLKRWEPKWTISDRE